MNQERLDERLLICPNCGNVDSDSGGPLPVCSAECSPTARMQPQSEVAAAVVKAKREISDATLEVECHEKSLGIFYHSNSVSLARRFDRVIDAKAQEIDELRSAVLALTDVVHRLRLQIRRRP